MIATVRFSKETRAKLQNQTLSPEKKRQLRISRVIEYIDSIPAGRLVKHYDVCMATGYHLDDKNSYQNAKNLINSMIKKGIIQHDGEKSSRMAHYKVVKGNSEVIRSTRENSITMQTLEAEAKEYTWKTGDDSLRGFINFKLGKQLNKEA